MRYIALGCHCYFLFGKNLIVYGVNLKKMVLNWLFLYFNCTCGLGLYVFQLGTNYLRCWGQPKECSPD